MTEWVGYAGMILGIVIALVGAARFGYSLAQQRAARDLARLRKLVPEPGLLRRAATFVGGYGVMARKEASAVNAAKMARRLRALADRIEGAGEEE